MSEKEEKKEKKPKSLAKDSSASDKIKERSREISKLLEKQISAKELVEGRPQPEKPKKTKEISAQEIVEAKKKPVKPIEKVEREISREIKKQEVQKEASIAYPFPEGIKKSRELAKQRKFPQTFDLSISVKNINLKKPENRFSGEFQLPAGRGKPVKVGFIADSLAAQAKKQGADIVITKDEIPSIAKNKKKLKKIANQVEWLYGEMSLMADIGRSFGVVLGPRGKIPKPIPPNASVEVFLKRARDSVKVNLKETPVIHVPVGAESMKDEDILRNLQAVYGFVKEKLPKGINSIRSMHIKLTMGKPVKLEVK